MGQENQRLIEEQCNLLIIDNFLAERDNEDFSPATKDEVFDAIRWLMQEYSLLRGDVACLAAELKNLEIKHSIDPEVIKVREMVENRVGCSCPECLQRLQAEGVDPAPLLT